MKGIGKPIKCWNCSYLGACQNCNSKGCDKFKKYTYGANTTKDGYSMQEIAESLGLDRQGLNYYLTHYKEDTIICIEHRLGIKVDYVVAAGKNYRQLVVVK